MFKTKVFFIIAILFFPFSAQASVPTPVFLYGLNGDIMSAQSFLVQDAVSGQVLSSKNPTLPRVPASLTKLVTALVVLESGADLKKQIAMQKSDEVGGARIATKTGVKYTAESLLHASLIASANNATNALVRATGLTQTQFVEHMNKKARVLGALNSVFVDPAGIRPENLTTAEDFALIARAAFSNERIQKITQMSKYVLKSTNYKNYVHNLKTTNQLLSSGSWLVTGAKTGFLNESRYNFVTQVRDVDGKDILIVLLGSRSAGAQFEETKQLVLWSWSNFKWPAVGGQVAGASTGFLRMPLGY